MEIKLSRDGNWLNINEAVATEPPFGITVRTDDEVKDGLSKLFDKLKLTTLKHKTELVKFTWTIGREFVRSIDSVGLLYYVEGTLLDKHARNTTPLRDVWSGELRRIQSLQACFRDFCRNSRLHILDALACLKNGAQPAQLVYAGDDNAASMSQVVRETLNEILAYQTAFYLFNQTAFSEFVMRPASASKLPNENALFNDFLRSTNSAYCQLPQRGASIVSSGKVGGCNFFCFSVAFQPIFGHICKKNRFLKCSPTNAMFKCPVFFDIKR